MDNEKSGESPKEKRLTQLRKWWMLSENAYNTFMVQAKEDLNFYLGGERQWNSTDLQKLKSQQRPALTYNHVLSLINLISGYQRQNRQDIKIFNRSGGSKKVAEILTEIIKHIHDNCYGDWETSFAFLIGIVAGIGWLSINLDYDEDVVNGDIVLESISPFKVYPDPFFERYDMRDAQFIFKIAWLPKSRIEMVYPEKKDELEGLGTIDARDKQLIPFLEGEKYHDADAVATGVTEIEKYRYRVKECWWREMKVQKFLIGTESGTVRQVDLSEAKIKELLKVHKTLRYIKRAKPVLNLTTMVGDVELEHIEDPLNGVTRFPMVPFFCYWIEKNHFGLITQIKDPQREINKRVSQALHHLNQSANSGWIADDNALKPGEWNILEDFGSRPGIVIKKKPSSHLERIQPGQISEGHLTLAQAGKQNIRDVSGVNPDLAGEKGKSGESGYLMELRRNQGLISVESVFDNFRLTKQILGRTLVDVIQRSDAYSREEILSLIIDGKEKMVGINQRTQTEQGVDIILNDMTVGKYKAVVSESPTSPTARLRNFYQLLEAVKAGLPIPPEVVLDASDLPMKDEIKQKIAEKQQSQQLGAGPAAGPVPAAMPGV